MTSEGVRIDSIASFCPLRARTFRVLCMKKSKKPVRIIYTTAPMNSRRKLTKKDTLI